MASYPEDDDDSVNSHVISVLDEEEVRMLPLSRVAAIHNDQIKVLTRPKKQPSRIAAPMKVSCLPLGLCADFSRRCRRSIGGVTAQGDTSVMQRSTCFAKRLGGH
jgi:hypothetical protein